MLLEYLEWKIRAPKDSESGKVAENVGFKLGLYEKNVMISVL